MAAKRNVAPPPGTTRVCPHCKSVILDSANVCPACQHHLRFGARAERRAVPKYQAFRVEGTIRPVGASAVNEYSVVISVRNDKSKEVKRHVIDVGTLDVNDQRTVDLSVEVFLPRIPRP